MLTVKTFSNFLPTSSRSGGGVEETVQREVLGSGKPGNIKEFVANTGKH